MFNQNYTSKILDLEDVIMTNVETATNQIYIYLELPRREHTCPICGTKTGRIHDYRMQTIKDVEKPIAPQQHSIFSLLSSLLSPPSSTPRTQGRQLPCNMGF